MSAGPNHQFPAQHMTAAERSLLGRSLINARWARLSTPERAEATQSARAARWARLLERADPQGVMPDAEREERARQLRRSDMQRLTVQRTAARRARKGRRAS
jgi:hypothetical protein